MVRVAGVGLKSTTTDAAGSYTLGGLAPGTYSVGASAPSYSPQTQTPIVVTESGTATANLSLPTATAAALRFVYDEVGRLVAAVDLNGETARFDYDAVGNLIRIVRQPSSTLSVLALSPHTGPAGTIVTISGTGFSTVIAENAVTFGGTTAIVTSASATSLVVTVPAGIPVGSVAVAVTVAGVSASCSTLFQIAAGS